jgi:hypothetical protein
MGESTSLGNLGEAKVLIKVDWETLDKELDQSKTKIAGSFKQTGTLMRNVGAAMTAGLTVPLIGLIGHSTMAATRVNELSAVNEMLGKSAGYSEDFVREQADAVQGMGIEAAVSQEVISDFIKAELDLADASKVARVAQDAAVIAGKNSTETTKLLTTAIITGRTELFKSAGMIIDLNQAYDDYAEIVGKASSELSEQEKVQARVNATMEYGERIAGAYITAMKDPGKVLRSYPRYMNDIAVAIGQYFIPAFEKAVFAGADFLKALKGMVSEGGALEPVLKKWGEGFEKVADFIQNLVEKFKAMRPETVQTIANLVGFGAAMGPMLMVGGQLLISLSKITEALGTTKAAFMGTAGAVGIALAAIAGLLVVAGAMQAKTIEMRNALLDQRQGVIDTTGSYDDYLDSLDKYLAGTGLRLDRDGNLRNKMGEIVEMNFRLTETQFNYNQAVEEYGDLVNMATEDLSAYMDEQGNAIPVMDEAKEALRQQMEQFRLNAMLNGELGQMTADYTEKLGEMQGRLGEIRDRLIELQGKKVLTADEAQEIRDLNVEYGELGVAIQTMADEHDAATKRIIFNLLSQQIMMMGLPYDEAMALIGGIAEEWGLVDKATGDLITATGELLEQYRNSKDVDAFIEKLNSIQDKTVTLTINEVWNGGGYQQIKGSTQGIRAAGGTVMAEQPYLAGERGPELYIPKMQGSIISNSELMRSLRGGMDAPSNQSQVIHQYEIHTHPARTNDLTVQENIRIQEILNA